MCLEKALRNVKLCIVMLLGFVTSASSQNDRSKALVLENAKVRFQVSVVEGKLSRERFSTTSTWSKEFGAEPATVETDGGFGLELMFTDWQAPRMPNNAENPVTLTAQDYLFERDSSFVEASGAKRLLLEFKGVNNSLLLRMDYSLEQDGSTIRRSIAVRDTSFGHHFLRWFWPRFGSVVQPAELVHAGGFGQPIALVLSTGSAFFGVEYPAAQNDTRNFEKEKSVDIKCGHEVGQLAESEWITSEPTVMGVGPTRYVKQWFFKYLDGIRVAPLKPYALYNSWYDLRSPDYPRVPIGNVMSEQSAMKMVRLLKENMIDRHGIQLDAFVLDDGWDVYQSDWVLRKEQWPNGLVPLANELAKTNTALGIWFGPTGGYSFRKYRLNWMKENGYETVGDQLCVGGAKYSALLKKRTTDFVAQDGVQYFKWDGIQFSCSEPNHGHPIDIYSRRAIMESVVSWCNAVREKDPATFLNITSGTWMSPWWVKYANTIWMQGEDYGYADVPSLSQRDGAITYRDFVLYEDFKQKGLWFPIANLMTHGIIKGKLELLGSPEEPIDKFTDDVLLYFARGVSMYELYISPDILSEAEWTSISKSLSWARDRFSTLMHTEMIGGNPLKREAYGYAHFNGKKGILAVRNPFVESTTLNVLLSPELGIEPDATQLVLECVYPNRWISPVLYRTNETVTIPLEGYETAVYEIYALSDAKGPLFAGSILGEASGTGGRNRIALYSSSFDARLLNPDAVANGQRLDVNYRQLARDLREEKTPAPVTNFNLRSRGMGSGTADLSVQVNPSSREGIIAFLVAPGDETAKDASFRVTVNVGGREVEVRSEYQEGRSQWFSFTVLPGRQSCSVTLRQTKGEPVEKARMQAWYVGRQAMPTKSMELPPEGSVQKRILPPIVVPTGELARNIKLGEVTLDIAR